MHLILHIKKTFQSPPPSPYATQAQPRAPATAPIPTSTTTNILTPKPSSIPVTNPAQTPIPIKSTPYPDQKRQVVPPSAGTYANTGVSILTPMPIRTESMPVTPPPVVSPPVAAAHPAAAYSAAPKPSVIPPPYSPQYSFSSPTPSQVDTSQTEHMGEHGRSTSGSALKLDSKIAPISQPIPQQVKSVPPPQVKPVPQQTKTVPPEFAALYDLVTVLLNECNQLYTGSTGAQLKKLEDIGNRVGKLQEELITTAFSKDIYNQVLAYSQALQRKDFIEAQKLYSTLIQGDWGGDQPNFQYWVRGLKTLFDLLKLKCQ